MKCLTEGCGPPTITFEVVGDLSVLPAAVEVAAYRIAQEAVSSATKHSGAQRITVRMTRTDNGLTVEIRDDGIGVAAGPNPSGVGFGVHDRTSHRVGRLVYEPTFVNRRHRGQGLAANLD